MTDAPTNDPLIGEVVDGRYRIEALLAQGGMGRVYEASDVRFHRRLVLKTLIPQVAALEASFERFLREARAAAQLGSAQIVGAQEFGELPDGRAYLVMEHVDGVTLDHVLNELNSPMPVQRALAIAHSLAMAMEGPHRAGIVHRDLKPPNVMLSARVVGDRRSADFVRVLDFGLAYVQSDARLTADGEIIGTPDYMAPEQCQEEPVDHRADLYAIGVMLYEMLTLELPIVSSSYIGTIRKKLVEDPEPPSRRSGCGHIPEAVDALVLHAISRDPDARFASVVQLREALERELTSASTTEDHGAAPSFAAPSFTATGGASPASASFAPSFTAPRVETAEATPLHATGLEDTLPAQPVQDMPPPKPAPSPQPAYAVPAFSAPPAPAPSDLRVGSLASDGSGKWLLLALGLVGALALLCLIGVAAAMFFETREAPDPPLVGQGSARAASAPV